MASTRELRRRIRSISSTAQITKAMQMVAASKMRKAQQAAINVRPFIRLLYRIQRQATTLRARLTEIPAVTVTDVGATRSGIVTFTLDGIAPDEIAAGHCVALSRPKELADLLEGYAADALVARAD